jgi:hypothetical protein
VDRQATFSGFWRLQRTAGYQMEAAVDPLYRIVLGRTHILDMGAPCVLVRRAFRSPEHQGSS